jgi:hypothetical protein
VLQQNADRVLARLFDAPRVEHVFAEQKDRMGLFIRTIGIARATTKIGMANLVYNIKRFVFLRKIAVAGRASIAQDALFDNSPIQIKRKSAAALC